MSATTLSDSESDSSSSSEEEERVTMGMKSHDVEESGTGPPMKRVKLDDSVDTGSGYTQMAQRMMAKMGYKEGKGLGKHEQGRVEIVEASKQRGRRGLGLHIPGLEAADDKNWDFEAEKVIIEETVEWLPRCNLPAPDIELLRSWKKVGPKKREIDDETTFCDADVLDEILNSKNVFDNLEPEEMRRARTRSNPYETIRGAIFLNRAAMKMANMDSLLDFMFTQPKSADNKPLLQPSDLLYFADICAGPGGFSEYILWRVHGEAKGFGLTLKGPCDFKLEDFFAGPPEMFEPHYGVGGTDGNGDIFDPANQAEFIKFVKENTEDMGVHIVMADGGFSVEGQENIQEILSKQLYLCQFLVAVSILRTGGSFVCKLFDLFTPFSVGLVYLMTRVFDRVSIIKPVTSRPANSERYIVCRNLRGDSDTVRQYMHEINLDLNKLLVSTSQNDINEIVPLHIIQEDSQFFQYLYDSNVEFGKQQILGLRKIQIFTQNTNLYEGRQADTKAKCLEKWKVPDEVRTAPNRKQDAKRKFEELLQDDDIDYTMNSVEQLNQDNLHDIKSPYDYRCYVVGGLENKRWYILGLGRSHVYKWDGSPNMRWRRMDDNMRLELPAETLIEAEFVQEFKGEGMGQKRQMTLHALDALYLYGKDVRYLHFNERMEKLKRFVKSITKTTRSDLMPIKVPTVFRFEHIETIFERLAMKKVKGASKPRLCYSPPESIDGRSFLPTGVCIIKTIKDPWTVALSRSQNRKYFYNLRTRESLFDIPKDSIASTRDTKLNMFMWTWEQGVLIHDGQEFVAVPDKLSRDNIIRFVRSLLGR